MVLVESRGSVADDGSAVGRTGAGGMAGGGGGFKAFRICISVLCILLEYSSALPISSSRSDFHYLGVQGFQRREFLGEVVL